MELRRALVGLAVCGLAFALPLSAEDKVKLDGYAEWNERDLIVDGERVRAGSGMTFEGKGEARSFSRIPLGYEVKVEGTRAPDGRVVARKVQAKPNGNALLEGQLKSAFDETEARYVERGVMFQDGENGKQQVVGELWTEGPEVDRVRRIAEDLVPPYMNAEDFRVYVVDNPEWNAMAAPNGSIYVFSGLLDDMDDDEVAIVLGHEMVHATHEHGRRGFKKQIVAMVPLAVFMVITDSVDSDVRRTLLQIAGLVIGKALISGYGRKLEDQADRVGLRYAWQAQYDVHKGPELWMRFADKYGEGSRFANRLFGDHSLARERAAHLRDEIRYNYPRPRR